MLALIHSVEPLVLVGIGGGLVLHANLLAVDRRAGDVAGLGLHRVGLLLFLRVVRAVPSAGFLGTTTLTSTSLASPLLVPSAFLGWTLTLVLMTWHLTEPPPVPPTLTEPSGGLTGSPLASSSPAFLASSNERLVSPPESRMPENDCPPTSMPTGYLVPMSSGPAWAPQSGGKDEGENGGGECAVHGESPKHGN